MDRSHSKLLLTLLMLALALVSCGEQAKPEPIYIVVTPPPPGEPTAVAVQPTVEAAQPTAEAAQPSPQADIQLLEVTFAHGLSEEMQPVDPTADFAPADTVYLSLKIKGRPTTGAVVARFYWREDLIAEASVDLADVNSGLLFSLGENTYAGYTLTHEEPFPLSDKYRADVFYGDRFLGAFPFRVVPPPEAGPSQVKQITLALGADENYNPIDPTTTFAPDDVVYLVGLGDLGIGTWLQADWHVSGQLDAAGTRSLSLEENLADVGFVFSYLPEGGWPVGEHSVVLIMNDQEVGRYTFTVVSPGG